MKIKDLIIYFKQKLFSFLLWNYTGIFIGMYLEVKVKNSYFFKKVKFSKKQNIENSLSAGCDEFVVKNVLFVVHWLELGGAESCALNALKMAHGQGYVCYVVSTVPSHNNEIENYKKYAEKVLDYSDASFQKTFCDRIECFIKINNIEVVHIHHSSSMYHALPHIKSRFQNIKIVDTTHIVEYGNGGFPVLSAKFSDFIDLHNVISNNLISVIKDFYYDLYNRSINKNKFYLTYLPSLSNIKPHNIDYENPNENSNIVFYGRFVMQKLPFLFITIMEKYFTLNPNVNNNALIYGDGYMGENILKRINKSKFKNKILYKGRCDDKREVFKNTKVLFICSMNEGLSLTAYEALCNNVVPISTDVGAQNELISDECLIPLNKDIIRNSIKIIKKLLSDGAYYDEILQKNIDKLNNIRNFEFNDQSITKMYQK